MQLSRFSRSSLMLLGLGLSAAAAAAPGWLESLAPQTPAHGFRAEALYLDDAGHPMGGRFVHLRSGFTLDLLQIQSVPQAFLWVNSHPTSDMGEPHTQEHLLLGKGNKGRFVASLEQMSLASSSAFTMQLRTCYHFETDAGPEVFYKLFERQLDALLHPDYTDEEIRREVRNFGVSVKPEDGALALEEKGTVYNEMVSSFERPWSRLDRTLNGALYGPRHPLAYVSGGLPSAIREMRAEDIRKFHHAAYHLGNMGMVASIPKEMPPETVLERLGGLFDRVQPEAETLGRKAMSERDLPAPAPGPPGAIQVVEVPNQNAAQPGLMVFAWAPERQLSAEEQTLLRLFVDNVAGDATTNLYKLFVDSQTRKLDLDAKSVFGWIGDGLGYPVFLGLEDVAAASLGPEKAALARQMVLEELGRIAAFADGSPELSEFNGRIRSRVVSLRRQLSRDLSSPPGFGQRGTGSGWMQHLDLLARAGGFRRSLALQPELDAIEQRLGSGKNFWRERLSAWKLTGAVPFTAVTRASPELLEREETERRERIAAEIGRLQALHGAAGEQETLRLYQGGYDAETAKLDELALKVETPTFLEAPPLTLDDLLEFKVEALPGGVPLVHSSFPNMSRATAGLALRLDGVPAERLVYLSALPELMIGTGVLEQGKPVSNEAMQERLRNEILGLEAEFSADFTRGRCELVLRGSGNTLAESRRAVQWMLLVLQHPDWRPENLPRIRDLVGQTLSELRNRMQQSEESWVSDPADAYRRQDHALLLAAESFLTRTHNLQRLRWLLEDAGPAAERDALAVWLGSLAGAAAGAPRSDLVGLLAALQSEGGAAQAPAALAAPVAALGGLPEGARKLAVQVAKDVELTLPGLPDASLAEDWAYLCRQIRADLLVPPASALAELDALRAQILKTGNARVFLISSAEGRQQLDASLRDLAGSLQAAPADPPFPPGPGLVRERLRQRDPAALQPVFVGLLNPNTQSGVFVNSAPGTSYADLEREPLLRYLAVLLYGGGGAHGIFMKTWGAGLAYSNGLSANLSSGRIGYYAERCPELPQTLRFVIGELKSARRDPALGEYAVAQAFPSRSALDYESRGEAIASNLVDGRGPEVVRRFRERLLELRREPKLTDALFDRLQAVVAAVLPGFGAGPPPESIENAVYMVIGPEKQMALYEQFLQSSVGPQARVHRLYPRDFWMPGPAANP